MGHSASAPAGGVSAQHRCKLFEKVRPAAASKAASKQSPACSHPVSSLNAPTIPSTHLGCLWPERQERHAAVRQHPRAAPRALQHAVGPAGLLLPPQIGQAAQAGQEGLVAESMEVGDMAH